MIWLTTRFVDGFGRSVCTSSWFLGLSVSMGQRWECPSCSEPRSGCKCYAPEFLLVKIYKLSKESCLVSILLPKIYQAHIHIWFRHSLRRHCTRPGTQWNQSIRKIACHCRFVAVWRWTVGNRSGLWSNWCVRSHPDKSPICGCDYSVRSSK